jgi:hypothetical protein
MTDIEKVYWDATDPLKRLDGESEAANGALNDYARMGYGRSLKRLHEHYVELAKTEYVPSTSYGTVNTWSTKYDWVDRVAAWTDIERKRQENLWRERRDSLRSKEWSNYERLQDIVSEMLEVVPQFISRKEKIVDDGTPTVILQNGDVIKRGTPEKLVITLKANTTAIIQFIKTASEIGRKAAEMDQTWMSKLMKEVDFGKLDNEQVARLADGEHILDVLDIRKQ